VEVALKKASILSDLSPQLQLLDRYERRAVSRRNRAVQSLTAVRVLEALPVVNYSVCNRTYTITSNNLAERTQNFPNDFNAKSVRRLVKRKRRGLGQLRVTHPIHYYTS